MVDIDIKIPAMDKLRDYAVSAIGATAGPMLAKWKAQKEADALRIEAKGTADALRIEAKGKADVIHLITKAQDDARKQFNDPSLSTHGELDINNEIHARIAFQEEKRQSNIATVVNMAAEGIKDTEVQDHEIDHDWTAQFFSNVQDVSSEKMQQIWARILSGEVETPGRTSLHTLTILKSLTQKDAELFSKMANFVIGEFIFKEKSTKSIIEFPTGYDFIKLSSYNLVHVGAGLIKKLENNAVYHIPAGNVCYRISINNTEQSNILNIKIPCYVLTAMGQEMYRFIKTDKNMDYLNAFAHFLKEKNAKLEYAPIIYKDENIFPTESFVPIVPK